MDSRSRMSRCSRSCTSSGSGEAARTDQRVEPRRVDPVHDPFADDLDVVAKFLVDIGNAAGHVRHRAQDHGLVRRILAQRRRSTGGIGGMMGERKSFVQQYFSSIRSVTHGNTGIGVAMPIVSGAKYPQQPEVKGAISAPARSSTLRSRRIPCLRVRGTPHPCRRAGIWGGFFRLYRTRRRGTLTIRPLMTVVWGAARICERTFTMMHKLP